MLGPHSESRVATGQSLIEVPVERHLTREDLRDELRMFLNHQLREELVAQTAQLREAFTSAMGRSSSNGHGSREVSKTLSKPRPPSRMAWKSDSRKESKRRGGLARTALDDSSPSEEEISVSHVWTRHQIKGFSSVDEEGDHLLKEKEENLKVYRDKRRRATMEKKKLAGLMTVDVSDKTDAFAPKEAAPRLDLPRIEVQKPPNTAHEWTHRPFRSFAANNDAEGREGMLRQTSCGSDRSRGTRQDSKRSSSHIGNGHGANLMRPTTPAAWAEPVQPDLFISEDIHGEDGFDGDINSGFPMANASGDLSTVDDADAGSPPKGDVSPMQKRRAMLRRRSSASSLERFSSDIGGPITPYDRLVLFVHSSKFDYLSGIAVILNALTLGMQTDWMAGRPMEDVPTGYRALELGFCTLFALEIALRIVVYRHGFFRMTEWKWNVLDLVLVGVQIAEEIATGILTAVMNGDNAISTAVSNFTAIRVLRLLRLVRIIRLVRVMRLISELRTLVMSILGSMRSLFWAIVLLFMTIYVAGIFFTQVVAEHRRGLNDDPAVIHKGLYTYYSSLGRTILSLYEAVTGGIDWDVVVQPLIEDISPLLALIFCLYIAFSLLAMMNAITGVFTETALLSAKRDKDIYMVNHVKELFTALDMDCSGMVTWEELEEKMNTKEMREYFKAIDVDMSEAQGLFKLLDMNDSGSISADDFLNGCLRIRGPARALEMMLLLRETTRLAERNHNFVRRMEAFMEEHRENDSVVIKKSDAAAF